MSKDPRETRSFEGRATKGQPATKTQEKPGALNDERLGTRETRNFKETLQLTNFKGKKSLGFLKFTSSQKTSQEGRHLSDFRVVHQISKSKNLGYFLKLEMDLV